MQFLRRCQDGADLAVKFFLSQEAYANEILHYQDSRLCEILVPVIYFHNNESGSVCTRSGYVFPPFIVVERGEVRGFPITNAFMKQSNLGNVCLRPVLTCIFTCEGKTKAHGA
jgi:hypothetical protein